MTDRTAQERIATLERRLDVGFERIKTAEQSGQDVAKWEAFWIDMLRSYEQLCAEIEEGGLWRSGL